MVLLLSTFLPVDFPLNISRGLSFFVRFSALVSILCVSAMLSVSLYSLLASEIRLHLHVVVLPVCARVLPILISHAPVFCPLLKSCVSALWSPFHVDGHHRLEILTGKLVPLSLVCREAVFMFITPR